MRHLALALAALGLALAAGGRAMAEGALSYPMAAHVAAKYGVQHPGLQETLHPASHRHHGRHLYGYGYRARWPVAVYPPMWRRPRVVVPFPGHPPVVRPRTYPRHPRYYYRPYHGFRYYGPGVSIGIRF